MFRTLKYRPDYPSKPFTNLAAATTWVDGFFAWYNGVHLHSGIQFVTPNDRHGGRDIAILARRRLVYEEARAKHATRWVGKTRNWRSVGEVVFESSPAEAQPEALSTNEENQRRTTRGMTSSGNNVDTHRR